MIHLDFETRSEVDIWEVGAWAYAAHPSTEILCLAYAIGDHPVEIVERERCILLDFPDELMRAITRRDIPIAAYNAFFEQSIWRNICEKGGQPRIPIKQWRCVMAKALARSLPRSLAECGKALNAPIQKDEAGKRVMMKMCKPLPKGGWHEDEEDFQKLYEYCINDVMAERAVDHLLPDLIPAEQKIWFLDQLINQRGVCVDQPAIEKALATVATFTEDLNAAVLEVSDGALDGVTRRMAVMQWVKDQGVDIPGYTKRDVKDVLTAQDLPEQVRTVLEAKLQLGKTSVKKYEAMAHSVGEDGRIRDLLIYHGASTGRWAGKLIQLHNLPKGNEPDTDRAVRALRDMDYNTFHILYPDVMDTLSSCIRGMIVSAPGHDLLVADYAAIEARVVMWLAREEYGLKQFREGADLYVTMAELIYSNKALPKSARQLGKAAVLGCGYGMGPDKFLATCTAWGIPVTAELAAKAVETYRQTYRRVYNSWFEQERAAIRAVETSEVVNCGKVSWGMDGSVLYCQLPSKRRIVYNDARIEPVETSWGEKKNAVTFMGLKKIQGQTTTKWSRQSTYGGKLVENITQAVARDILAEAMYRAETLGYKIAFSVHDEIVSEVPEGFGTVAEFEAILCKSPSWAQDCPITAEGWRGKRYKK